MYVLSTKSPILLLGLTTNAFAENSSPLGNVDTRFNFNQLIVACPLCRQVSDTNCEIVLKGELTLINCENGISALLKEEVSTGKRLKLPTADNATQYLLANNVLPELAQQLLRQVLSDNSAPELLLKSGPALVSKYAYDFIYAVRYARDNEETLNAIWRLPILASPQINARLRATVVSLHSSLTVDDLRQDLTAVDLKNDLAQLKGFGAVLSSSAKTPRDLIGKLVSGVSSCLTIAEAKRIPESCSKIAFQSVPQEWQKYLFRAQMAAVVNAISNEDEPELVIGLLTQTKLKEYRTPQAHALLVSALMELSSKSSRDVYQALSDGAKVELLSKVVASDKDAAAYFARCLAKAAEHALVSNNARLAFQWSERALFFDDSRSIRTQIKAFLPAVVGGLKTTGDAAAALRAEQLLRSLRPHIFLYLCLIFLTLLAGAVICRKYAPGRKVSRVEASNTAPVSATERQELRELMEFFRVQPHERSTSLTRRYRDLAKTMHPDAGGNLSSFVELNEKYERARELVAKSKLD